MSKHKELFTLALALFIIGIIIGLQPEVSQPIIENAQQMQIDPYNFTGNLTAIFINNSVISIIIWLGWFLFPVLGLGYFPPTIMLYSVGATFGAVFSYVSPLQSLLTLFSFGILEASGLIFGMSAGLVFPKYVYMKITRAEVVFGDYMKDSLMLFIYSIIALGIGALLETNLINPLVQSIAAISGIICTFVFLRFIFTK